MGCNVMHYLEIKYWRSFPISPLLSYDFYHNISIGLLHDKKCCNCINLFPCIFVGFYCIGFSIKLVKTQA